MSDRNWTVRGVGMVGMVGKGSGLVVIGVLFVGVCLFTFVGEDVEGGGGVGIFGGGRMAEP